MKHLHLIILFVCGCTKPSATNFMDIAQKVDYYNNQYLVYQRVDVSRATVYTDSMLKFSEKNNYAKGIGLSQLNLGILENIKGNFNLAIQHNEKALTIFITEKDDTLKAKALAALGSNYWQKGEYDKAMQYQLKALKLNEQLNLQNEMATCYNYISMIYQSKYQLALAEEYANKSFEIVKKTKPDRSHISIYHNIANIYGMQAKYKEALSFDSIGLDLCKQLKIEFNKSMFYDNIANCYYYSNDFDNAILYHFKAITIDSTFNNNKLLGDSYCNLGTIYSAQKKYDLAVSYYKKSIELCKKAGYKVGVKNAAELLAEIYFKTNRPNEAYDLLRESMLMKDSIINEASEQKIAELQTLYDTEKKQQQISQQALKISRRNVMLIILGTVLLLTVFIFRLIYYRYKFRQEKMLQQELLKEEAKRSKAILESEENERQRLARELHDGVGQLLSATKLNLSTLESEKCTAEEKIRLQNSISILDDSIREIRNISHNMVPDALIKYGLKHAIVDFVSKINQTKKIQINFECNGFEENSLEDTEKLMLYRIIQESVNNALKYAQATQMSIQLSADINEISLLMEDNGKGFDIEEVKQKAGIGLKNMQLRTDYLKGKFEIESSPKNGTTIIIEIPLS